MSNTNGIPGRETSCPSQRAVVGTAQSRPGPGIPHGSETVLLVDDEPAVRRLVDTVLRRVGYTVLSACTPLEALRLAGNCCGPIDLLLTDVMMPGLGGGGLSREVCLQRPGLKVLYMSGLGDDAVESHGVAAGGTAFLQKPFTTSELAAKVRQLLDEPVPAAAAPQGEGATES